MQISPSFCGGMLVFNLRLFTRRRVTLYQTNLDCAQTRQAVPDKPRLCAAASSCTRQTSIMHRRVKLCQTNLLDYAQTRQAVKDKPPRLCTDASSCTRQTSSTMHVFCRCSAWFGFPSKFKGFRVFTAQGVASWIFSEKYMCAI